MRHSRGNPFLKLPDLDDACGRHFTYRDIVECGETWLRTRVDNVPLRLETFAAISDLCCQVLDPVVDTFGPIILTYGLLPLRSTRWSAKKERPQIRHGTATSMPDAN